MRYYITIILILTTAAANYAFSRPQPELPRRPLREFPKIIDGWKSMGDQFMDDGSMRVLKVDDYIMRTYVNARGEMLGLYIGYFKTQYEGKQVHSPRQCLPGAGWDISENKTVFLKLKDHNPAEVPINYYLMGKGNRKDLYLWWYQGRGRIYANEYLNKWYMMTDAVTKRRTDGALVRINMAITGNVEDAMTREIAFIDHILPILSQYIPN